MVQIKPAYQYNHTFIFTNRHKFGYVSVMFVTVFYLR